MAHNDGIIFSDTSVVGKASTLAKSIAGRQAIILLAIYTMEVRSTLTLFLARHRKRFGKI
jgi:hypothetical protein